jgi:hypothetical protein
MVECWNIGKLGFGILHYWGNGPPKAERYCLKWIISYETPLFHRSTIPFFHAAYQEDGRKTSNHAKDAICGQEFRMSKGQLRNSAVPCSIFDIPNF